MKLSSKSASPREGLRHVALTSLTTPGIGGIDRYTIKLYEGLKSLDGLLKLTLFQLAGGGLPGEAGDFRSLPRLRLPFLSRSLSLLNLNHFGCDVLHFTSHPTTPIFAFLKGKVVITVHGMEQFTLPARLQRVPDARQNRWLNFGWLCALQKSVSAFVTVSHDTANKMSHHLKISKKKIHVIPHGVDHNVFKPCVSSLEARNVINARFPGLKFPYLFHVSHHQQLKNITRITEAFEKLLTECPNLRLYHLVIAGIASRETEKLQQESAKSKFGDKIIFLGSVGDDRELAMLYGLADIFLFPSIMESFGLPVLEAMACGTPVMTARVGGIPEVGGDACVYVEPHAPADWISPIRTLLLNKERRTLFREKSLKRAAAFSWRNSAQCHADLYERVAKER